jgi:hypothetical protein
VAVDVFERDRQRAEVEVEPEIRVAVVDVEAAAFKEVLVERDVAARIAGLGPGRSRG